MNRDGFISVIGIIIIGVVFFSCLHLVYFSSLQTPLTISTLGNIQSRYLLEEKLYRLILDNELFDSYLRYDILAGCRGAIPKDKAWKLKINDDLQLNENFTGGNFSQPDRENLNKIIIKMGYEFGNIKKGIEAELSIINHFFNSDESIIKVDDLLEEEIYLFENMMEDLHDLSFNYDSKPSMSYLVYNIESHAIIEKDGLKNQLSLFYGDYKINHREYTNEALILNLIHPTSNNITLTIGSKDDSSLFKTKGVFYIEGDLIINQALELDGIIIVNGGKIIVNTSEPSLINGMIIYNGEDELDEDKLIVVHNKKNIIRYGSYLPVFLDPVIKLIKYN